MNKSYSLTFPLIRVIHEHHQISHKNGFIRFCQQKMIDRVLALSLPLFACFDVLFHLSAALVEGVYGGYKSLIYQEVFSIDHIVHHLKVARLFREVIFTGASYVGKPNTITAIFENSLTRFVRALLLSGSPDVFADAAKAGGTNLQEVLDVFCRTVKHLPEHIQETMEETLKLVKEAHLFQIAITPKNSFLFLSCENGFHRLQKSFNSLKAIKGCFFTKLFKKELPARLEIITLSLSGLFVTPLSLIVTIIALLREVSVFLLTNQDTHIKTILWRIKLDLLTLLRMYIAFPFTMIGGMIDPFKVQSVFYSPLYKGDEKVKHEAVKLLFKKIEALKPKESALVPLGTYINDPSKNQAHYYCILITKQELHYRVSIINRGWGNENHHRNNLEKSYADVSYDGVSFIKIENYLACLIGLEQFKAANKAYKIPLEGRLEKIGIFKLMLYGMPELWRREEDSNITKFQSEHVGSCQKIGNCGVANLMSAISFHSAMQTVDMTNKISYKRFIYSYKKMMFDHYKYLLDFDLQVKKFVQPSFSAERQLDKMKIKLCKT